LDNLALGAAPVPAHVFEVSGSLTVHVARQGRMTRLVDVRCTFGRHDKPYPEAHGGSAWTVALVRRGAFEYRTAETNRVHTLRPGWLLVGRPDAEYECSHAHDGGDDCASISIPDEVLRDVASAASMPESKLLAAPPALPPHPRVAALLERARVRDGADIDEVGYFVAEAFLAQACQTRPAEVAPHPSHAGRIQHAIDAIESGCREEIALADVAAEVGLSPFHFLRVFRRVTGTTPHQYLIGARLRLAARLLLDTDRPVTDIAYDVGFQDLSNFVRTFHRVVGCSPRAYRGNTNPGA
jgi:AraC family transcriptional regulator